MACCMQFYEACWSDEERFNPTKASHAQKQPTNREELDLAADTDDIDQRLKYAGIFHRRKRTPGRFMMRCVCVCNVRV